MVNIEIVNKNYPKDLGLQIFDDIVNRFYKYFIDSDLAEIEINQQKVMVLLLRQTSAK